MSNLKREWAPNDAANTFYVRRLMRNSYMDELRTGQDGNGMMVRRAIVENDSASAVTLGIGARLHNDKWLVGSWTAGTSTLGNTAAYTADAQDAGASDVPLSTTTNNDGHIIGCAEPFSAVLYDVGTAALDAGGAAGVTGAWTYWNGSSFAALTPIANTIGGSDGGTANRFYTATRYEVVFEPPSDWRPATSSSVTGAPTTHPITGTAAPSNGWYFIRYAATDAPSTSEAKASTIQVWDPLRVALSQVAANTVADLSPNGDLLVTGSGEGLVVCITTADAGNLVSIVGEDVGHAQVVGGSDGDDWSVRR